MRKGEYLVTPYRDQNMAFETRHSTKADAVRSANALARRNSAYVVVRVVEIVPPGGSDGGNTLHKT